MEFNNSTIDEIKKQIKETDVKIDELTEKIKAMQPKKNEVTDDYENKKADFEDFKSKYAEQSTFGLYFLLVSAIVFVIIAIQVYNNSIVSFFIYPALALLIIGIVGKVIGSNKFKAMTPVMKEKEALYKDAKEAYETFMAEYNSTEDELEKNQLKWELVENDMIEARKDAWIQEQRKKAPAPKAEEPETVNA